ncbi:hypothetical protein ACFL6I_21440 [candidate division KSB1 bacterium]
MADTAEQLKVVDATPEFTEAPTTQELMDPKKTPGLDSDCRPECSRDAMIKNLTVWARDVMVFFANQSPFGENAEINLSISDKNADNEMSVKMKVEDIFKYQKRLQEK